MALQHISLILALALPGLAAAAPYQHTMSGDQFAEAMRPDPKGGLEYQQREKAYSYLDGARDALQGSAWCDVYQQKTPDLAYEAAADIAKLPPAERKRNAALLLAEWLHKNLPCKP
jgi:hypothetical protein